MLKWYESDPDGFDRVYHQRSLVESLFSCMKCRFGGIIRAKKLGIQRLQLVLRCMCYNSIV